MPRESYPYVRPELPHANEYKFPPLLVLKPPPVTDPLPALPSPLRSPSWLSSDWQHSTHIVPAAWPRTEREVDLPHPPSFDSSTSKDERTRQMRAMGDELCALRDIEMDAPKGTRTDVLWICLDRYVRRERDGKGVTLFLAHANGFNKETWEPMLRSLLDREQNVSEIWIWDAVNHGDSALLNQGKLNSMFHWHEAVRDLLNFLVYHLPTEIKTDLPTHIPHVSTPEYVIRYAEGFSTRRKLVMVGHSFGGCISTLAAIRHPVLFSSLILVDPVVLSPRPLYAPPIANHNVLAVSALGRRSVWPSRQEALAQLQLSSFFQRWHPDVLAAYIEHGIYDRPDGSVALKMGTVQEAVLFSDTWTGGEEAWVRLYRGELDPKIELRWLLPGRGERELQGPGFSQVRAWLRKENSSNVLIEGAGHLITHERPNELAEEVASFVHRKYGAVGTKL